MKRPASRKTNPVQSRCKLVKAAVQKAADCSANVKDMLASTINLSVGTVKADRHPFNERFVVMIGEVLNAEHARLTQDVATKEAAFAEISPARATREAAVDQAKADAMVKAESEKAAKEAVVEIGAKLKEANAAVKEAEKAQKTGDADLDVISGKKASLEDIQKDSLGPLVDGSASEDTKAKKVKAVLETGKTYGFDSSLLTTAEPVLEKVLADRGTFDATCLEQLQAAFASAMAGLDAQLAEGAPGKAERAGVVEAAQAAKAATEATQTDLKEKHQAAKEAKAAADAAAKGAVQSLADFMPDLKKAGDALDQAREDLKEFGEGPLQAYSELKDLKEGDFAEPEEPEEDEEAAKKAKTGEEPPEGEQPQAAA